MAVAEHTVAVIVHREWGPGDFVRCLDEIKRELLARLCNAGAQCGLKIDGEAEAITLYIEQANYELRIIHLAFASGWLNGRGWLEGE